MCQTAQYYNLLKILLQLYVRLCKEKLKIVEDFYDVPYYKYSFDVF